MAKRKKQELMSMEAFEKQMAEVAVEDSARLGVSDGNLLSIRGGSFTLQGEDLGTELDVVILDFVSEKSKYDGIFDEENPSAPGCFAITHGDPTKGMEPVSESANKQADQCNGCWSNEFGSDDRGKGKACKDVRKLILTVPDELSNKDPMVVMLKVPPTSIKDFSKFVKGAAKLLQRPPYGIIATISFDDDAKYEKLLFTVKEVISKPKQMQKIMELREANADDLMQYDISNYVAPKKTGKKKKAGAKKAVAKKSSTKKKRSTFS